MKTVAGPRARIGEPETNQGQHERARVQDSECAAVDLAQSPEGDRRDQDTQDHQKFQECVHTQWGTHSIGYPAADDAADRHASEEARQDGGDRLRGVAEDKYQLACPHNLVNESGKAGQHEDQEDDSLVGDWYACG